MRIRRTNTPQDIALHLFAYTKGHGVGFRYLETGKDHYDVTLKLPKETIIAGKLLGPNGDPLAEAAVRLCSLRSTIETALI